MSNDETKVCPVCAETIKKAAIKCRYCDSDLHAYLNDAEALNETIIFEGRPAVIYSAWQWCIVGATLGLAWLFYWLKSISIHFEISSQRAKLERGIFSLERDNIELFTIEHFDVLTPLGMRLLGYSVLELRSSDISYPSVRIYGIKDLSAMGDTLRECSLRERARRRVTSIIQP